MDNEQRRKWLNKKIYELSARKGSINPVDTEAVKIVRDSYTEQMYGKNYKELTITQLQKVFEELNRDVFGITERKKLSAVPILTQKQARKLRFLAIEYALQYHDFTNMWLQIKDSPKIEGELLREIMKEYFSKMEFERFPMWVVKPLFTECANPVLNRWLLESNLKKRVVDTSKFYYDSITETQANYLIKRLEQIRYNYKLIDLVGEGTKHLKTGGFGITTIN